MMLERQAEGIAIAKQKGKYKSRKPTARGKAPQVMELLDQELTKQAIADHLGIGVASVYRIIKEQKVVTFMGSDLLFSDFQSTMIINLRI